MKDIKTKEVTTKPKTKAKGESVETADTPENTSAESSKKK